MTALESSSERLRSPPGVDLRPPVAHRVAVRLEGDVLGRVAPPAVVEHGVGRRVLAQVVGGVQLAVEVVGRVALDAEVPVVDGPEVEVGPRQGLTHVGDRLPDVHAAHRVAPHAVARLGRVGVRLRPLVGRVVDAPEDPEILRAVLQLRLQRDRRLDQDFHAATVDRIALIHGIVAEAVVVVLEPQGRVVSVDHDRLGREVEARLDQEPPEDQEVPVLDLEHGLQRLDVDDGRVVQPDRQPRGARVVQRIVDLEV